MIVVMKKNATENQVQRVVEKIQESGLKAHLSKGEIVKIIGIIGDERKVPESQIMALEGVEKIMPVLAPYKLASRDFKPENTIISVDGVKIGGNDVVVMAGPCSVESREQIIETAKAIKKIRSKNIERRCIQAKNIALFFPGLRGRRVKIAEACKGGNRHADNNRGYGHQKRAFGVQVR